VTFTKPGLPNQLSRTLGQWNPQASLHHTWHATFNASDKAVYLHAPLTHPQRFELIRTMCTYSFYHQPQSTQLSPITYPLTLEIQRNGFCISLPVPRIPPTIAPPITTVPHTILGKIQSSLPPNLQALWTLKPHSKYPIKSLTQYISQDKGQILIVTDASLNTQKFSTFSWTIATATHKLWIGEGAIPGTRCGAHSGWSEGYGFLSAMIFLKKYLQATNYLPNESTHPIVGYCNNLGLIQLITAMQTNKLPNPLLAISNDYDLTNKIFQMILCIPVTITLSHVKGHHDNNTLTEELPYPAQLNIACDKHTWSALATLPINVQPYPSLPSVYPQLQIQSLATTWIHARGSQIACI